MGSGLEPQGDQLDDDGQMLWEIPLCHNCDALVDDDGFSIGESCCFYCKAD